MKTSFHLSEWKREREAEMLTCMRTSTLSYGARVNVFEWQCARTLLFDHYIMHLGSAWRKYLFCTMDTFKCTWSETVLNVPYKHTITTWCYFKRNKHYRIRAMNFNNWQSRSMHRERPDSAWSKEFYPAQLYCRSSSRNPLPCLCLDLCWVSPLNCCLCSSPTIENKCGLPQ